MTSSRRRSSAKGFGSIVKGSPTNLSPKKAHQDERNLLERTVSREDVEHLPAVDHRHHEVEQDEHGPKPRIVEELQRLPAIPCGDDIESLCLDAPDRKTQGWVVIDDKDDRHPRACSGAMYAGVPT